jgi:beta-glucanase (GH16 family)
VGGGGIDGGNVVFFDDFNGPTLSPAWTVISRHGEYAQSETECNVPQAVKVESGDLLITTSAMSATCGDFNIDGTVRHAPSSWPYVTGDVQWKSLSFTYGTVTIRAKFPSQGTGTWPALWLLGQNCQQTNPKTADVGYDTCPDLSSPDYAEIDMVECDLNNWCQLALSNVGNFPTCGFQTDPLDTNYHVFELTWTVAEVAVSIDGVPTGCSFSSPQWVIPSTPMFLIMQTQTGGAGGAPHDSALPAMFAVDWVRVTQP